MNIMRRITHSVAGYATRSVVLKLFVLLGLFLSVLYHVSHNLAQRDELDRIKSLKDDKANNFSSTLSGTSNLHLSLAIPYESPSPQSASAQLQSDVSAILATSSTLLISAQSLSDNDNNGELELSINAETSQSSLLALLYKLETHRPTLLIKDINIRIREDTDTSNDVVLGLSIVITALWKAN